MAASDSPARRTCRVSVVGLSGRDKGAEGVGKSCLCDRFVRGPVEDDFRTDHISEVSQSDFVGSVINNRHFLYWGRVEKRADSTSPSIAFEIVEQTEFTDDATFATFPGQSYAKRAVATKLESKGKIAYANKDQMAIPADYPVSEFPSKFAVDGFLVVVDAQARFGGGGAVGDAQLKFLAKFLPALGKTKKPVVAVATKCDVADEAYVREIESTIARLVKNPHLVETSAVDDVNVDHAFHALAHLVEKGNRTRAKIVSYAHANRTRQALVVEAKRAYQTALVETIGDFQTTWERCRRLMTDSEAFRRFVELRGVVKARRLFAQHVFELKERKQVQRRAEHLTKLPKALEAILSDVVDGNSTWAECQATMREHDEFEHYFVVLPDGSAWDDDDWLVCQDSRVPSGILALDDAATIFDVYKNCVLVKKKKMEIETRLRSMLDEADDEILPGMSWAGVKDYLAAQYHQYEDLLDDDALGKRVWKEHEEKIRALAKDDFRELLYETPHLFDFTRATNKLADQRHIFKKALQEDLRYQQLQKCEVDRSILIWNHVAFLQKEPKVDARIREGIAKTKRRGTLMINSNNWITKPGETRLKLLLLGSSDLAHELKDEIAALCTANFEFEPEAERKVTYSLDIKIIDDDEVSTSSFASGEFTPNGCVCIFSNTTNLQYVTRALEGHVIHSVGRTATMGRLPFRGLPITLIQAVDPNMPEADQQDIAQEGEELAKRLQCGLSISKPDSREEHQSVTSEQAKEALVSLISCIKHRETFISVTKRVEAELRLAMYVMDNDPYPVDQIMGPLLRHQCCWRDPDETNVVKMQVWIEGGYRCVEVTLLSPQGISSARRRPRHGFILAYSAIRRASYNNIKVLSEYLSQIPTLVLAVTSQVNVETGSSDSLRDKLELELLQFGNSLAIRRNFHFVATSPQKDQPETIYLSFFKEAWKKRFSSVLAQMGSSPSMTPMSNRPPAPLPPEALDDATLSSPSRLTSTDGVGKPFGGVFPPPLPTNPPPSSSSLASPSRRTSAPQGPLQFTYYHEMRSSSSSPNLARKSPQPPPPELATDDAAETSLYAVVNVRRTKDDVEEEEEDVDDEEGIGSSPPPPPPPRGEPLYATPHDLHAGRKPTRIMSTKSVSKKSRDKAEKVAPPKTEIEEEEEEESQYNLVRDAVTASSSSESPFPVVVAEKELYASVKDAVPEEAQYALVKDAVPTAEPVAKEELPPPRKDVAKSPLYATPMDVSATLKPVRVLSTKRRDETSSSTAQLDVNELRARRARRHGYERVEIDDGGVPSVSQSSDQLSLPPPPRGAPSYSSSSDTASEGSPLLRRRQGRYRAGGGDSTDGFLGSAVHGGRGPRTSSGGSSDLVGGKSKTPVMLRGSLGLDDGSGDKVAARRRAASQGEISVLSIQSQSELSVMSVEETVMSPRATRQFFISSRSTDIDFYYDDDGILCIDDGSLSRSLSGGDYEKLSLQGDWSSPFLSPDRRKKERQKQEAKRIKEQRKVEEKRKRELRKEEKRLKARSPGPPYRKMIATPAADPTWNYFGTELQELEEIQRGARLPIFVAKCVKAIENHGLKTEGLYRVSGKKDVVDALKTKFDSNLNVDFDLWAQENVHVLTTAVKSFFQELPEPLFPEQVLQHLLNAMAKPVREERQEKLKNYVEGGLPSLNYRVLKHIVVHLHKVIQHSDVNKMTATNLSIVFWPTLVRPNITNIRDLISSPDIPASLADMMTTLIKDCDYFFGEVDTTDGAIIEIPANLAPSQSQGDDLIDFTA